MPIFPGCASLQSPFEETFLLTCPRQERWLPFRLLLLYILCHLFFYIYIYIFHIYLFIYILYACIYSYICTEFVSFYLLLFSHKVLFLFVRFFTLAIWEGCSALCPCVWGLPVGRSVGRKGGASAARGASGPRCRPWGARCCGSSPGRHVEAGPRAPCTRLRAPRPSPACLRGCASLRPGRPPC